MQSASALTYDELQGLTYMQVKGTGIANTCPTVESGDADIKAIKSGEYQFQKFCMEPTSFTVKEESFTKGVCQDQAHDPSDLHPGRGMFLVCVF
jgi:photosystem II oxygen-evolving enhancer protein 1